MTTTIAVMSLTNPPPQRMKNARWRWHNRIHLLYTFTLTLLVWCMSTMVWYSLHTGIANISTILTSQDDNLRRHHHHQYGHVSPSYFQSTSSQRRSSTLQHRSNANTNANQRTTSSNNSTTNTKIPPILIFTHSVNLLQTDLTATITPNRNATASENTNNTSTPPLRLDTNEEWNELRTLQQNVYRIIALHTTNNSNNGTNSNNQGDHRTRNNSTTVRFLTDQDCITSIQQWAWISAARRQNRSSALWRWQPKPSQRNNGNSSSNGGSASRSHAHRRTRTPPAQLDNDDNVNDHQALAYELISYFQTEETGMFKADLCRGVALYETGGIYMDIDLGIRTNVFDVLLETSEFVTVTVHKQSHYPGAFFQAFIAVVPHHDVIHRYIELFILYYRRVIIIEKGPIGVILLKQAYDEIQYEQEQQLLLLNQQTTPDATLTSVATPVTTHLQQTTELWQEILYLPQYQETIFSHVPMPTWGHQKRACKFVVVVPPTPQRRQWQEQRTVEYRSVNNPTSVNNFTKLIVPMYSRIAGSRMCPKST